MRVALRVAPLPLASISRRVSFGSPQLFNRVDGSPRLFVSLTHTCDAAVRLVVQWWGVYGDKSPQAIQLPWKPPLLGNLDYLACGIANLRLESLLRSFRPSRLPAGCVGIRGLVAVGARPGAGAHGVALTVLGGR